MALPQVTGLPKQLSYNNSYSGVRIVEILQYYSFICGLSSYFNPKCTYSWVGGPNDPIVLIVARILRNIDDWLFNNNLNLLFFDLFTLVIVSLHGIDILYEMAISDYFLAWF